MVRSAHHVTPRRYAGATDYSDLSESDARDSGKTREKAQPIYRYRLRSAASSRQYIS